MIIRIVLQMAIVFLLLPSAAADGVRYDNSNCLAFPSGQGFFTDAIRIVMRASGTLETGAGINFKACRPAVRSRISLQRQAAYSSFSTEVVVTHSDEGAGIPLERVTTDSADPPILGGGRKMVLHYVVPPLQPGDELHENVQAAVASVLLGNQFWIQGLPGVQDSFAYKVLFESERSDVTARLVDPAKVLIQLHDASDRKEWRSDRPTAGVLSAPRIEITTLGDWAKVARQFRAAYFIDSQNLTVLQATGMQPASDPDILFKEFADQFGALTTSESRFEPRSLSSILQTRGGDCKSLTFLFLNLLRWGGTDAELVLTSEKRQSGLNDIFAFAELDHVLVYVPSLGRYFDPTVPAGWQQRQLDQTIRTRERLHVAAPSDGNIRPPGACADYCILPGNGESNSDPIRVKTEAIRSHP